MEGAFYLWAQAEIEEVLSRSPEATELFKRLYYVKPEGNCDLSPRRRDSFLPVCCAPAFSASVYIRVKW